MAVTRERGRGMGRCRLTVQRFGFVRWKRSAEVLHDDVNILTYGTVCLNMVKMTTKKGKSNNLGARQNWI